MRNSSQASSRFVDPLAFWLYSFVAYLAPALTTFGWTCECLTEVADPSFRLRHSHK